jgi:hypothetical protein
MTAVAVAIQVYDITKSSFAVGIVGIAQLLPLVVLGLFGGAMSDSYDRRMIGGMIVVIAHHLVDEISQKRQ